MALGVALVAGEPRSVGCVGGVEGEPVVPLGVPVVVPLGAPLLVGPVLVPLLVDGCAC